MNSFTTDELYMRQALDLAAKGLGRTSPNPAVGCVIVRNEQVVGEGFHQKAGTPHAEVHALRAAGERAAGATAYVTLEPCSHFGRTPPCADALIQAGIRKVVVATPDPNPLVAGRGIERLRQAGIEVTVGILEVEARRLNEIFLKSIASKLPFVVYKAALSLDGKIATETGDSKWVSNEKSRAYAHRLRNIYDVILAGSETILRDDPALNCRLPEGRDPVRVVVDGLLRIPDNARVFSSSPSAPCIVATTMAAPPEKVEFLRAKPALEVWQYPTERHVPLPQLLRDLLERGWTGVLLEGGGRLAGAMIVQNLVDKLEFFIAPKLVGGNGPSPLDGLRIATMNQAIPVFDWYVSTETGDLLVCGYLNRDTRHEARGSS